MNPGGRALPAAMAAVALLAGAVPALPVAVLEQIGTQWAVDASATTWEMTSCFLTAAVLTPVIGRLGDVHGRRRVLLSTLGCVLLGTVFAALAPTFGVLLVGRVLQGTCGALFSLVLSMVHDNLHGRRRTVTMAVLSASLGVGGGMATVVSGLLASGSDIRRIFWIATAMTVAAIVATLAYAPADRVGTTCGSVDRAGAVLLALLVAPALVVISRGGVWGWTSPATVACAAVTVAAAPAFLVRERHAARPLVPLTLMARRPVVVSNVAGFLVGGMMLLPIVLVPLAVQASPSVVGDGDGVTPLRAALVYLLPGLLVGLVAAPAGGYLTASRGPRSALVVAGVAGAAAFAVQAAIPTVPGALIGGYVLLSAAVSMGYAAMPALLGEHVPQADIGVANGVNSLSRWLGGAVFTSATAAVLAGTVSPSEGQMRAVFVVGLAASIGIAASATLGLRRPGGARPEARSPAAHLPSDIWSVSAEPGPQAETPGRPLAVNTLPFRDVPFHGTAAARACGDPPWWSPVVSARIVMTPAVSSTKGQRHAAAAEAAQRLQTAARTGTPCPPVRDLVGTDDVELAYAVQRRLTQDRLSSGARIVGRKIGLTSPAVQKQLGVDRPDFGVLFADMDVSALPEVPSERLLQPKTEAEIAFLLGADLADGPLDAAQVRAAVESAVAALEIVDSRIAGWDITFGDTVADNASSGLFVLGEKRLPLAEFEPVEATMRMTLDGDLVSEGTGAACLGDPLLALAWLARTARDLGDPLRAGQVVLSGALGPMVPTPPGSVVSAEISGLGPVSATFSTEARR